MPSGCPDGPGNGIWIGGNGGICGELSVGTVGDVDTALGSCFGIFGAFLEVDGLDVHDGSGIRPARTSSQ
jgi:hypothetical protein